MSGRQKQPAGWYPDQATGGTQYWDGARWTGIGRPPRRAFAAKYGHGWLGWGLAGFGVLGIVSAFVELSNGESDGFGEFLMTLLVTTALAVGGVYMLRGQGPSDSDLKQMLKEQAETRNPTQPVTVQLEDGSTLTINLPQGESEAAAQVKALANPETAKALQNLQNLLYTQAITDEEYQRAKDRLLGW